jgi:hypothetical protein
VNEPVRLVLVTDAADPETTTAEFEFRTNETVGVPELIVNPVPTTLIEKEAPLLMMF